MMTERIQVPLTDLAGLHSSIRSEIDAAIQRVVSSGGYILGPEVESFEQSMAAYCGVPHAVGVASGTDALELALMACGVGAGDEVITTPFTFIATVESIVKCGATPVFVDIDPVTWNIDVSLLEGRIGPRTRAILPVHLYGHACDMTRLMGIARAHKLKVVEDCAQALGARWNGAVVGTFGDAGCLSFFPSKVLGALGDGGMVITGSADVAERVRILRNHGARTKYYHLINGFNSRLDALQAAVLQVKLRHLNDWLRARKALAACYADGLRSVPGIVTPEVQVGADHVFNYYTVRVQGGKTRREALAQELKARGVSSAVYYPVSLHLQQVYRNLGHQPGSFVESERAQDEVLSLPMCPFITETQAYYVVESVREAASLLRHSD